MASIPASGPLRNPKARPHQQRPRQPQTHRRINGFSTERIEPNRMMRPAAILVSLLILPSLALAQAAPPASAAAPPAPAPQTTAPATPPTSASPSPTNQSQTGGTIHGTVKDGNI